MPKPISSVSLEVNTTTQLDDFSIQESLPYKLYHIRAIHERIVYANMTRITGVTLSEWRVMANIASGIVSFTQLAEELLLDKGQLSNIIKQLQKKQLVDKQKSVIDARKTSLSLTPLGHEKKSFIIVMVKQFIDTIQQGLDEHERAALSTALGKVESNIRQFWSEKHG